MPDTAPSTWAQIAYTHRYELVSNGEVVAVVGRKPGGGWYAVRPADGNTLADDWELIAEGRHPHRLQKMAAHRGGVWVYAHPLSCDGADL